MKKNLSAMSRSVVVMGMAMFFGLILSVGRLPTVWADDGTVAALVQKNADLEKRITVLEAKPAQPAAGFQLPDYLKDLTISGFVDTSYVYNVNHPDSGKNTARVFDTEANSFSLQAAKLAFERLPAKTGGAGFRIDLMAGDDAQVTTPYGFDSSKFDVEQAYVDVIFPVGKGLDVKAGRFVTLAGAEVIESKDNWNYSRSLLFGYAIPFTHTGVRASYPVLDTLTAYLGVNNGWDDVKDNNKGKTVESSVAWAPKDWFSTNIDILYGPEEIGNNHSNRALFDFVVTFQPIKKLTLKVNVDYANEQDAVALDKNGTWSGVAGYARYDFNDKWSLSDRIEYFADPNGLRIPGAVGQYLWENTPTLEFRPYKSLITRLEYRYDHSTDKVFTVASKAVPYQNTFSFEAIYVF
jgi:hypothetical protein